MTISSNSRQAGPFTGNDTTTAFPFTFKVFEAADLVVVRTSAEGVDSTLTLGSDYSVTLNANQNSSPGGTITLGSALATGTKLTATSGLSNLQPTDLTNQGGFYPRVINDALDRLTILVQQAVNAVNRSVKFPISDGNTGDILLPAKDARKSRVLAFNETTGLPEPGPSIAEVGTVSGAVTNIGTVATNIDDVNTVAGIAGDVTTVSGISANVTTVAGVSANVTTVAGNDANVTTVAGIATDVSAVAAIAADVSAVENIAANVTTVAGIQANVSTVAGVSTEVTTVAGIATDVATVAADGTDIGVVAGISTDVQAVSAIAGDVASVENIAANVTTVAGISANVTTVAGVAADVTTVAGISADVAAVENIAADVTAVAGIAADVSAVVADATDIGTVATNIATVTAVATDIADINTCADNIAAIIDAPAQAASAAASAAAAAATLDNFDDRYLGSKTSDPALDNDGNALVTGALYYNSVDGVMKVYDGAQWLAASAASQAILVVYKFTATAGQTTFTGTDDASLTLGYTAGSALVTLNGVMLEVGTDVTATNGTSVVLASGAVAGDELNVYAFSTFDIADVYTKAQADSRYTQTTALGDLALLDSVPASAMPAGSVLQVVQGFLGNITTTSGSTVYSGVAVSITPTSATSKILALFNPGSWTDVDGDSQGSNNGFIRFEYSVNGGAYAQMGSTVPVPGRGGNGNMVAFNFMLEPATTQTISFRVGVGKLEGSRAVNLNTAYSANTVTLMEIAA